MNKPEPASSVTETEARADFGHLLRAVVRDGIVYITRDDRPEAVLLSLERFEALSGAGVDAPAPDLESLTQEFDGMLARMQTAEAAAGADALFRMGPDELGEAALRAARTYDR